MCATARFVIERDNGYELSVVGKTGSLSGPYTQRDEKPRGQVFSSEREYRAAIRNAEQEHESCPHNG